MGSQVISRHQRRFIDGTPWSLQTSYYPMGFVVKGADRSPTPATSRAASYDTWRTPSASGRSDIAA